MPSVKIGVVVLPKEGCCIRFNPVVSSRSKWLDSSRRKISIDDFLCKILAERLL